MEYFLIPELYIDKQLFTTKVKEQCESGGHFGTGRFKFYSGLPDDETLDYLVDKGFDPKMGARPLQRVIDQEIKRSLARELLFGDLKNGGTLIIDTVDNKIVLNTKGHTQVEKV